VEQIEEWPTIDPAMWRVGRSPGVKAVGASTEGEEDDAAEPDD